MKESIKIILRTYSKGEINDDEAVQLIEDLYRNKVPYIPYYFQTYEQPISPIYKVTC